MDIELIRKLGYMMEFITALKSSVTFKHFLLIFGLSTMMYGCASNTFSSTPELLDALENSANENNYLEAIDLLHKNSPELMAERSFILGDHIFIAVAADLIYVPGVEWGHKYYESTYEIWTAPKTSDVVTAESEPWQEKITSYAEKYNHHLYAMIQKNK